MNSKNKKLIKISLFYVSLIALCFIRALATYVFIVPNAFAPGGVSGIASLIYNGVYSVNPHLSDTWLSPAFTILVMNVPLLILAFKFIDKSFALNTMFGVLFYSGFMALLAYVNFPQFAVKNMEVGYMMLAALAGGAVTGVSLGFMLLINATIGGTDIIGKLLAKHKPVMNTSWFIFVIDCVVVLFSGILAIFDLDGGESASDVFVLVSTPILYSFISLLVTSKVADVISHGAESSVVFNIITDKYEEVADVLITEFNRGVTIVEGEGYYTHNKHKVVICVAHKKQIVNIKRKIRKIDSNAFIYITNTREVSGQGFKHTY